MFPATFVPTTTPRAGTKAFGRLGAVFAWVLCAIAIGSRPAVAQTDEVFGHAPTFRTSPEAIQRVRLLGIEAIDAEGAVTASLDTVEQATCGMPLVPPAADEAPFASVDDPCPPAESILGRFDDLSPDRPDQPFSLRDDLRRCLPVLGDDALGAVNWNNAAILGAALGAAIGFRQGLDEDVRDYTAEHPDRWGDLSKTLGYVGEVQYQAPVLLSVYAYSLYRQDDELHRLSGSLLSAYTISGLTTISIKAIANTDRPSQDWNDGQLGFPSFHTSSSFSIASVLDEYYGPKVGLPAYALAGLIGWSRIDERDHDLSDVVFGAVLGFVIGKSVACGHLYGDSRVRLLPYVHPTDGTSGLMLDIPY